MDDTNRRVIEEFRAAGGRVGGMFEGSALLLLTATGARTGRPRTVPLGCQEDGDRLLVFASNAGSDRHPAWYHNVRADPRVRVEVGTEAFDGVALPVEGEERDRLYARRGESIPQYAEYQRRTERAIPVVALHRASLPGRAFALGDELVRIHADLRASLAGLRADVLAHLDGGAGRPAAAGLGAQLRAHCLSVCDVLGEHHDNEEGRAFPRLESRFPGLAPVIGRLRREHARVGEARRELLALVDDLETADPAHVRAELDRMTAELDAHFAYEEEELGAVLNAVGPEWAPPRLANRADAT